MPSRGRRWSTCSCPGPSDPAAAPYNRRRGPETRDAALAPVRIDLNADVGERDEPDGGDDAILGVVTSASVACGAHAGSRAVMEEVVAAALVLGVAVGAHPSYPDRAGFGRRPVTMAADDLADELAGQVGELVDVAHAVGSRVRYVKAHGALYNAMAVDGELARLVARAVRSVADLAVLVPAGTPAVAAVERTGLAVAREGFCDRTYRSDGTLVPRDEPGAVVTDPASVATQAVSLACRGGVGTVEGGWLAMAVDSLCVHGDTPGAAAVASAVRDAVEAAGVAVAPFSG